MTAVCEDQTCQDIINNLEASLDIKCEEFDATYSDLVAAWKALIEAKKAAGAAWRQVKAGKAAHKDAKA